MRTAGRELFFFLAIILCLSGLAVAQGSKPATKKSAGAKSASAKSTPDQPVAATKQIRSFDPDALDKSADPCTDFYQFACGGWVKNNPIPGDQPAWGRFNELGEKNRDALHDILEKYSHMPPTAKRTANQQKIGDYYAACMNETAINKAGLAVLKPEFDQINAIKDKAGLAWIVAHMHVEGVPVFFQFYADADAKNAREVIAQADQGGLGLPERDYYLKTDETSVSLQKAYVEHVANMFKLLGEAPEKAAAEAKAVMNIETELAKGSMAVVDRREPAKVYHKVTMEQWQALNPTFSLQKYFSILGAPRFTALNVVTPDFFKALDNLLKSASMDDLKAYLRWHFVHNQAPFLPRAIVDENFSFFGKTLNGQKELRPRWKRCVSAADGDLGEALGQVYVERNFPPEARVRILKMVQALESALSQDIKSLPWMTDVTKKQAMFKLAAIENKIGYPDKWRDYSSVSIFPDDALGNSLRAQAFEFHRVAGKIGKVLDKKEWGMTPPTVNAYYNPYQNNINFPAGILQPPFFDFKADDGLNFGGIGAVIGHELTHGFDDEGRQFDAAGNLRDWWTDKDAKAFSERAQCLIDEYSSFVAVDEVKVNGKLTLGENTADNGGLRIADMALLAALPEAKLKETIDGYTPEQRLFLGWGQVWCQNMSDQFARRLALTNPHSPGKYRVNGVVRNMPEFQRAWSCKQGQPMAPQNACRVW